MKIYKMLPLVVVSLLFLFTFQVCVIAQTISANPSKGCVTIDQNDRPANQECNGISVGDPKVFDNRTLTLMLESLSQALAAQQQSYIDQKSVLAALSNLQGFSQSETSTNLSITGSPTPSTDVKTALNTGIVDSNGNPLPNTTQKQTDASRASVTPQAPALDTLPALQGFSPTYGSSASDLLNDQVNLTYQIFNLRMILERSLTDRLLSDSVSNDKNKTRLQAVLGFNVTIDPPRIANDAVAVVEIKVTRSIKDPQAADKNLSLVSLMPQEKTYNAAALNNKSNAFGGAAVVSAFQVGFSARKRGQIFYLYRDNDTLSYERMTGDPNTIVFGWMFRPVLGRRSVSPGLRQMFAILALPNVDCAKKDDKDCTVSLTSHVKTYWKKYDRKTLTSFVRRDANRASVISYGLSFGLNRPQLFEIANYENDAKYETKVDSSFKYESELRPQVNSVEWRPVGTKNVVVSVMGNNLFTNTQIAMGDKIYSKPEDGLILKSNQGFDFVTSLDSLASGPGTIIGRYGISVPLILNAKAGLPQGFSPDGVELLRIVTSPAISGNRRIEIWLRGKPSQEAVDQEALAKEKVQEAASELAAARAKLEQLQEAKRVLSLAGTSKALREAAQKNLNDLMAKLGNEDALQTKVDSEAKEVKEREDQATKTEARVASFYSLGGLADLSNYTPVLSINGKAIEMPYYESYETGKGYWLLQANFPDTMLSDGGGLFKLSWPFFPLEKWTISARVSDPDRAFEVTRFSQKSILINRIDGRSFLNGPEVEDPKSTCWRLIAGEQEFPLTSGCSAGQVSAQCQPKPSGCLSSPISEYTVSATVDDLPDKVILVSPSKSIYTLAVPELKAKDTKVQPLALKQYDAVWVEVKPGDLTTGATPKAGQKPDDPDLSTVTLVEANGKALNAVKQQDVATPTTGKSDGKPAKVKSFKIEITRELTSKPGTIDIAFHAGEKILGTRQIQIARTEWSDKEGK